MDVKVSIQTDYILVEPPKGLNYWDILVGLGKIVHLAEYSEKNDIWVFRDGPVMLTYEDLYKIRDLIKEYYPRNMKRNKTALVVETGFQFGLAESFSEIGKQLPFETKVFANIQSAEDWIMC